MQEDNNQVIHESGLRTTTRAHQASIVLPPHLGLSLLYSILTLDEKPLRYLTRNASQSAVMVVMIMHTDCINIHPATSTANSRGLMCLPACSYKQALRQRAMSDGPLCTLKIPIVGEMGLMSNHEEDHSVAPLPKRSRDSRRSSASHRQWIELRALAKSIQGTRIIPACSYYPGPGAPGHPNTNVYLQASETPVLWFPSLRQALSGKPKGREENRTTNDKPKHKKHHT